MRVSIPHRYDYDAHTMRYIELIYRFQSHTGTITTASLVRDTDRRRRFNPTQVRLRRLWNGRPAPLRETFQSHTGTITTFLGVKRHTSLTWFQSHTGTITTLPVPSIPVYPSQVSIPHRYDYDENSRRTGRATTTSFNPTQVRLRHSGRPPAQTGLSVSIPHRYDYDGTI